MNRGGSETFQSLRSKPSLAINEEFTVKEENQGICSSLKIFIMNMSTFRLAMRIG